MTCPSLVQNSDELRGSILRTESVQLLSGILPDQVLLCCRMSCHFPKQVCSVSLTPTITIFPYSIFFRYSSGCASKAISYQLILIYLLQVLGLETSLDNEAKNQKDLKFGNADFPPYLAHTCRQTHSVGVPTYSLIPCISQLHVSL